VLLITNQTLARLSSATSQLHDTSNVRSQNAQPLNLERLDRRYIKPTLLQHAARVARQVAPGCVWWRESLRVGRKAGGE